MNRAPFKSVNNTGAVVIERAGRARRAILVWVLALAAADGAAAAQWKPEHAVEIVVGVGPGGGVDRTARTMQKILQEKRLVEMPVSVVNKPGGGGTLSQVYLNQHAGDAHYLEISATTLLTNHITGKSPHGHRDFTPIAMLYDEYIAFLVRPDSPIRSGKDLIELLRRDAAALPIGIATSAGNTNHIAAGLAAKAAGADVKKLKVVVFGSGGESTTALLGGHLELVTAPAATALQQVQAGALRMIAVSAPQRLRGALASVPTWREQGLDIVVANWRPVLGPKALPPAQLAFWEDVMARFARTPEWQQDVDKNGGVAHYMGSRELATYLDAQYLEFKAVLSELGLAR